VEAAESGAGEASKSGVGIKGWAPAPAALVKAIADREKSIAT
jgi:hypothetical protein